MLTFCLLFGYALNSNKIDQQKNESIENIQLQEYKPVHYITDEELKDFGFCDEYGNYYLIQDCILLHSIILSLFENYLSTSINLFVRRNYSQSNLFKIDLNRIKRQKK